MRALLATVRAGDWWAGKVGPVVAVAAVAATATGEPSGTSVVDLLLLVVSAAGVAAFGHLLNDLCDRTADASAGRPRPVAGWGGGRATAALAGSLGVGLLPWLLLPHRGVALALLALEVVLLVAYSVRPLRLKGRGLAGAIADALYAYVVPLLLTVATLGPETPAVLPTALLAGWALLAGLRSILTHQVSDGPRDAAAGTLTAARILGLRRTTRALARGLLPAELALAAALVVVTGVAGRPWLLVLAALYVPWRLFEVTYLWERPLRVGRRGTDEERVRLGGFVLVDELVERWLPLAASVAAAVRQPWWWVVVAVALVAFPTVPRGLPRWVLAVPEGGRRLRADAAARREARRARAARRRRLAGAPSGGPTPDGRGFAFVVCGSVPHLRTCARAVADLRRVTDLPVWVVTDRRRNAEPLDVPGATGVVDVRTPRPLDHHQASIWLKTSLHRRLPPGEWCYLDTDVLAVSRGVEEVFDQPRRVVAFASDRSLPVHDVDWFSPHALRCGCAEVTDHCTHLREELAARFGVEVPAGWVHWNGGVFTFDAASADFLDTWHERAVASFAWPLWRTRDQGALISTVWSHGLQDAPRLGSEWNFLADLRNHELALSAERGWALAPEGPFVEARFLHLYTSPLEDPRWDLHRDVEALAVRALHKVPPPPEPLVDRVRRAIVEGAKHVYWHGLNAPYWTARKWVALRWIRTRALRHRLRPHRVRAWWARRRA